MTDEASTDDGESTGPKAEEATNHLPEETSIDDVLTQLEELEEAVDTHEELKEVQDVQQAIHRLPGGEFVRKSITRYTTRDVAEGFVGSILISVPLLVEDGIYDIADHFLSDTIGGVPYWLVANIAFLTVMTWGLLYWADFRDVHSEKKLLGLVPRRLVAVLLISLLTATMTMTLWGRIGDWSDPAVVFARIAVVWTPAAFGAALGDILPGQSSGTDIRDVPDEVASGLDDLRSSIPRDD